MTLCNHATDLKDPVEKNYKVEMSWKEEVKEDEERQKDGLGPVMVSDSFCPAVHILGT